MKKISEVNNKVNEYFGRLTSLVSGKGKTGFAKLKASLIALTIGIIIGIIPMSVAGGNVGGAFIGMFILPLNKFIINNTILIIAVLILLSTGIAVSFKSGLFNIGAPGQFLLAGTITMVMGIQFNYAKAVAVPLMILISMLVGALAASIAGIFKAFFNVHEVVSTIMINWIIFGIFSFIIKKPEFKQSVGGNSKTFHEGFRVDVKSIGGIDHIWIIILTIALVILITGIFKFTTIGFRMKANGESVYATKYAGMNNKLTTVTSMSISGAYAGLAGYLYYASKGEISELSSLPTLGFEAITITLLSFSSPMLCIPFGVIFGIIKSAVIYKTTTAAGVNWATLSFVIGILIFVSAFAPIFINFTPITWSKKALYYRKNKLICKASSNKKTIINKEKQAYKEWLAKYKDKLKRDKGKIKKVKAEQELSLKEYRKYVFDNNISFEMKKIIQNEWHTKIKEYNLLQHSKKITQIEYGKNVRKTNAHFAQIIEEYNLNELTNNKIAHKAAIRNANKQLQLIKAEAWNKHTTGGDC